MKAVVNSAHALGVSEDVMLAALGVARADLERYDVRIPYDRAVALWRVIEDTLGDPLCGLAVAQALSRRSDAALFQYTVRSAPTIALAWEQTTRLLSLLFGDDGEPITLHDDDTWWLGYRLPVHVEPPIERSEECLVVTFIEHCRANAPLFDVKEVTFQHATTAPIAAWRRALGCPVAFDAPWYGVRISERAYHAEIKNHDPGLQTLLAQFAQPLLAGAPPTSPAAPAVRAIRRLVDRGEPVTVDLVAKELHVSRRTLQRQLADAGTSVRGELEHARKDAAIQLLQTSRATIAEIAMRLGFSDASQFTRAVRRWTGATPKALRARGR